MNSLVRVSFNRIAKGGANLINSYKEITLIRTISSRTTRSGEDRPSRPTPWPYKEKGYNMFHFLYDRTTSRFDDNSKILVVEGPPAAGKTKFAKHLATELEMLYLPEANLDMEYINSYGYDIRKLDQVVPESCRTFDVMDFLKNPKNKLSAKFQIEQYSVRYSQYIDALAHVLSTGQGVVLDRSPYSDFVFIEAMYSQKYISKAVYHKYYEFRSNTIDELMRPHLVIYLDVPVPKVIENIQKRAISYEKDSPVLTPAYLSTLEHAYKQKFLKEISTHSELLIYDWSEEGDVEIVVEDIERISFYYDDQDRKLEDWRMTMETDWAIARNKYADRKDYIMTSFNIPCWGIPELTVGAEEADIYLKIMEKVPGEEYEYGYNKKLGDSGLLFKMKVPHRDTLPLRERRKV